MHAALHVSKTGLSAQDTKLTTIANNLANASTIGFKRDRAVFEDLLYQIQRQPGAQTTEDTQLPSGLQLGTGVRVVGTQKQFTTGSMEVTDNSLDIAINGRGFLQILQADGGIGYTRDGQLHLNQQGQLVNANGQLLQPVITTTADANNITIGEDGTVSLKIPGQPAEQVIGNIQLVNFINPAGLQAIGSNTFVETASSGNPLPGVPGENGLGQLKAGMLESSNVDIVEEMVNMITTQRTYEMNSKIVSTSDQMLQFITQNL
ncbi:MAG: flagellar basal-body rod protein FlgG [Cellvibrionaceae bacterium]|nr:flagellar basal-body rod protein FlgG [Cellvibrionaceae bacterium]